MAVVREVLPATPQYCWPLLCEHLGAEVWLKHENQLFTGAFKVRGGLVYLKDQAQVLRVRGLVSATRGNHGQSLGFAARRYGIAATIVVPVGNSVEKNKAMRALGVTLVETGIDFQEASEHAVRLAQEQGSLRVPAFHPLLVAGVATYAFEWLLAAPVPDRIYVPIGMGSGICGVLAVRELLGLKFEVIGVVSSHAPAYALSWRSGNAVAAPALTRLADGLACRAVDEQALAIIRRGVARIVEVSDHQIAQAMRTLFECTHQCVEGAGAAAFAAATLERHQLKGQRVGVVVSGGNVDREVMAKVLANDDSTVCAE